MTAAPMGGCRSAVAAVLVLLFASTAYAQPGKPTNIGAWTLNVAKSRYGPGAKPKSSTLTYELVDGAVRVTSDTVAADGSVSHATYTTRYDGADCPVTGTNTGPEVTAVTRVDAYTTRRVNKFRGKVTTTQTAVVSRNGKTLTVVSKGTSATGLIVDSIAVYDRR